MNGDSNGIPTTPARGMWGSKLGFVLAAAGSAIGLGNIWKFPYICGENGGGAFVLIYLVCIALVGMPIMIAEIMLGRMTQKSPVGAFESIAGRRSPWKLAGGMGVLAAFFMLSFYSVVAGWGLHYTWLSIRQEIAGHDSATAGKLFGDLVGDESLNLTWHVIFMGLTILVVIGGVQKGIERWSRILMPALFLMLCFLLFKATEQDGFERALDFVFGWEWDHITSKAVLEALGHSFFTLSLGMGAMITYGSYLRRESSLFANATAICFLDTLIALMACMILFPITFTYGMAPAGGPGLVFQNMPVALAQMPGGSYISIVFFGLLVFAALTSAISLLEVIASYFIDQWKWTRRGATIACGVAVTLFGIPSALSNSTDLFGSSFAEWKAGLIGDEWGAITKDNWFDTLDYFVSNWMLPLGGLFIAVFAAWRVSNKAREAEFLEHSHAGRLFKGWLILLRYLVPAVVVVVCLNATGLLAKWGTIQAVEDWFKKLFG